MKMRTVFRVQFGTLIVSVLAYPFAPERRIHVFKGASECKEFHWRGISLRDRGAILVTRVSEDADHDLNSDLFDLGWRAVAMFNQRMDARKLGSNGFDPPLTLRTNP